MSVLGSWDFEIFSIKFRIFSANELKPHEYFRIYQDKTLAIMRGKGVLVNSLSNLAPGVSMFRYLRVTPEVFFPEMVYDISYTNDL